MGCNFKIASIVIATLAITFSSLTLVKLCMNLQVHDGHHGHHGQKIDDGGVEVPHKADAVSAEPWAEKTSTTPPKHAHHKKHNRYEEISAKFHHKSTKTQQIVGIIVCIVSIITSFMIFGAVSDNQEYNQYKRHLILPFVVFHSLIAFLHAVAIIYVSITFRAYMDVLIVPVLVYVALVLVTVIGISFVATYYKSLSRGIGFAYAQMEDLQKPVDEVKVPLA